MINSITKAIIFVCCHSGPADHFATFSENLTKDGYDVQIYASGPALKKLQDRNIEVKKIFSVDNLSSEEERLLALEITKACSTAYAVISDVGHKFDISLQETLAEKAPKVLRIAYYDNPESPDPYLPADYSTIAKLVMNASQKVIFSNANLAKDPTIYLPTQERIGLGYYPVFQADKIAKRRDLDHVQMRSLFIKEQGLQDLGQKVLTYFGGNNQEYFNEAFPAFLQFLSEGIQKIDLSNLIIVLQQHPGAKGSNLDRLQLEDFIKKQSFKKNAPRFVISNRTTDDMQIITEGALYHQTSMGPLLAISGIPLVQIGAKPYKDVLIKGGLCPSVTNSSELLQALSSMQVRNISP
ncbi:MAG: hypothetical protein JSS09_06080, partial [Verrucomicrobia bacterium]|nr:hypothetical protein [Verrucomicrobiota bacterium]